MAPIGASIVSDQKAEWPTGVQPAPFELAGGSLQASAAASRWAGRSRWQPSPKVGKLNKLACRVRNRPEPTPASLVVKITGELAVWVFITAARRRLSRAHQDNKCSPVGSVDIQPACLRPKFSRVFEEKLWFTLLPSQTLQPLPLCVETSACSKA